MQPAVSGLVVAVDAVAVQCFSSVIPVVIDSEEHHRSGQNYMNEYGNNEYNMAKSQ